MPVIKMEFGRAGLIAGATSETFLNQMACLREARAWCSAGDGAGADLPRFSEATLRYLERALLARGADLRDAVFQLAHLVAAAARIAPSGRALDTLYGFEGPVRARRLAAHFAPLRGPRCGLTAEEGALVVAYDGGQSYRIAHARLPLLMALAEFLLTAPDTPEQTREAMAILGRIEAQPQGFETVRTASNALAALLSGALDRMLRGRAERDRFEALAAHLDARAQDEAGAGEPRFWRIDDDAILGFWTGAAETGGRGEDFRQFRTVHRAFVALVLALREGEDFQRLYRPQPVETEEGVVQIAEEDGSFETLGEGPPTPLDALAEDPAGRIKFLTGAERAALEIPARLWGAVGEFPLSVLRSEVMGGAQNEIANALRFGRPVAPLVALEQMEDATGAGYAGVAARWEALRAHLRRMLEAAAHVAATRRGLALPEPQAEQTRRAFRGVRRAGFAEAFEEGGTGEGFEAAIGPLSEMGALVARLGAQLPEGLGPIFEADRDTFAAAFARLYGNRLDGTEA